MMAELTREARQVLAEMELLSYGKAASWNSSGGKGEKENPVPQGDSNPLHEFWRREFERAEGYEELMCCLDAARIELDAIKRRDPSLDEDVVEEPRTAWEARLIEEGEGYEARHVATSFMTGIKDVMRIRRQHGCDPNDGRKLELEGSERDLAKRLGVSKTTARRLKGRAA
jgi:hypothetical protein